MTICKKGNAVGFTSKGETITGQYLGRRKAWFIGVCDITGRPSLSEPRNRSFVSLDDAKQYAQSLIDSAKTQELAWW